MPDFWKIMSHHINEEAEDKATRQNQAAAIAARYDYEHWSKTGELRLLGKAEDARNQHAS